MKYKSINLLCIILVIFLSLISLAYYFIKEKFNINIVGCDCLKNPTCGEECPNYVSPYVDLSKF